MIEIRRLNMDSSWQFWWQGMSVVIDPWLIGSEVDIFSWLNEQWHITDPVPASEVGVADLMIISQPYSDHCHAETLRQMNYKKMIAVKPAKKRLEKEMKGIQISQIPEISKGWIQCGPLQVADLVPDKWIDPIYHALAIKCGDEVIFYAPHGFELSEVQMQGMRGLKVKLLITTFSYFRIPSILGGLVNPGMVAVKKLAAQLHPENIVNTHDEQKRGKGLVMKTANAVYAEIALEKQSDSRILHLDSYDKVSIS
jgi:hypothetical protein